MVYAKIIESEKVFFLVDIKRFNSEINSRFIKYNAATTFKI